VRRQRGGRPPVQRRRALTQTLHHAADSGPWTHDLVRYPQTTYFGALGLECLPEYNPADFFLDVVSMDYRTPEAEAECRERVRLLAEVYAQSQGGQHVRGLVALTPDNMAKTLLCHGRLRQDGRARALCGFPDVSCSPCMVLLRAGLRVGKLAGDGMLPVYPRSNQHC